MAIIIDGTTGIDLGHTPVNNGTNYEVEGNLSLSGVGAIITGDFSNLTFNNRTIFQSSVPNGNTGISLIPNGTSTVALHQYNTRPDIANSSSFQVGVDGTVCRINSFKNGTGIYLPIVLLTGNSERMRIDTSGNVLVTGSGGLGYGTGSGGTVVQLTSKGTSVTLNKPSGTITCNNSSLDANSHTTFLLNNSLISIGDQLIVNMVYGTGAANVYNITAEVATSGVASIGIWNFNTSTAFSEAIQIRFSILKGATS